MATALSVPLLAAATARTSSRSPDSLLAAAAAAARVREDANRRDRNAASERETSVDASVDANGRTANGRTANGRPANRRTANGRIANAAAASRFARSRRVSRPASDARRRSSSRTAFPRRRSSRSPRSRTSDSTSRTGPTPRAPVGVHAWGRAPPVGVTFTTFAYALTLAASFVAGAAVDAVCGLARLAVIDADDGVSAPVVALAASSLVTSFGIMFGYMPILALRGGRPLRRVWRRSGTRCCSSSPI